MHLVGFIVKKLVTMHGHMNVKFGGTRVLIKVYNFQNMYCQLVLRIT